MTKWTADRDYELLQHVEAGLSARVIGQNMGTTRNAIVGRCHRLGFKLQGLAPKLSHHSPRERPARRRWAKPKLWPLDTVRALVAVQELLRPVVQEVAPETVVVAAPISVTILDLTDSTCRWPTTENPPHEFCGALPKKDRPYCPEHCKLAYVRSPPHRVHGTDYVHWGKR